MNKFFEPAWGGEFADQFRELGLAVSIGAVDSSALTGGNVFAGSKTEHGDFAKTARAPAVEARTQSLRTILNERFPRCSIAQGRHGTNISEHVDCDHGIYFGALSGKVSHGEAASIQIDIDETRAATGSLDRAENNRTAI
jgi:hypothetical protein